MGCLVAGVISKSVDSLPFFRLARFCRLRGWVSFSGSFGGSGLPRSVLMALDPGRWEELDGRGGKLCQPKRNLPKWV